MEEKIYSQPDQIIDAEETKQGTKKGEKTAEEKELEKKVKEYEDLGGLSTKKLNFGLWYAKNALKIKKFSSIALIIVSFSSWGFTIYNYAHYYIVGVAQDEAIIAELAEPNLVSHTFFLKKASQELSLSNVNSIQSSEGKYDLYIKIQNSNANYWAEIDYCFMVGQEEVECGSNFILPDETKHIMALSQEIGGSVRGAVFNIKNIVWQRINPHEIYDWEMHKQEYANITIDNIEFTPPQASGLSEKVNLGVLEFDATNNTGYSYWEAGFNIILSRGSLVAGINRYKAEEFMSGETREIVISWPENIQQVSNIDVEVELNIMDPDNFIKPEGGIGEVK